MNNAILGIGSNIGNRVLNIYNALHLLAKHFLDIRKISHVYKTKSLLKDEQRDYFNIVVSVFTVYDEFELLNICQKIERCMGRKKTKRWGERVIDVDILDFERKEICSERLILPHPKMHERSFVLYPLKEIVPDYLHPVLELGIDELIVGIKDDLDIKKIGVLKWP